MSYTRHHAIVLTSWSAERLAEAHAEAVELGCTVSNITEETGNAYRSFLVAPDGSGEGWPNSEQGWRRRCALIDWLRDRYDEDGDTSVAWVEVQFDDDELETQVTRSSDHDQLGIADVEEVY